MGASLYSWYKTGKLAAEGTSITEGIGTGRITANLEDAPVDEVFQVPDAEALPVLFDLARHEGLILGGSSAINIAGAIRLAKLMGPGHLIAPVLFDSRQRSMSKHWNPPFPQGKELPAPAWT